MTAEGHWKGERCREVVLLGVGDLARQCAREAKIDGLCVQHRWPPRGKRPEQPQDATIKERKGG